MPRVPFHLIEPDQATTSVVFASPHSGRQYDTDFLAQSRLNAHEIRSSEDAYVDLLYDCAPQFGASFLHASAPRAFLDLNRAADELDSAVIAGVRRVAQNPRIASGLGVIPRVVAQARPIYAGKLPFDQAQARIASYWHPYHDQLQVLLDQRHRSFGEAILIDCHSMPREALENSHGVKGFMPEIVLGDRFGASASTRVIEQVEAAFGAAGFRVARNVPFAGAYITQHYGRPSRNQHAVQIEIDRSLYMDEATLTPHDGFDDVRARLAAVIREIAAIGRPLNARLAAE